MKLSLNQQLFLRINDFHGRRLWFDKLMIFCSRQLIWLMLVFVLIWLFVRMFVRVDFVNVHLVLQLAATVFFSYFFGYIIAYFYRHPRPIRTFPEINLLSKTMTTWKSFPSDHTMGATLITLLTFFIMPVWLFAIFAVLAFFIIIARVYVGVHYPADVVGGATLVFVCFYFVTFLFSL